MNTTPGKLRSYPGRRLLVLALLSLVTLLLTWRAVDLQVFNKNFLQGEGNARHLRVIPVAAHRGMITDRNGDPLAISTPVDSVWANPQLMVSARASLPKLAKLLSLDEKQLQQHVAARMDKEFIYLKRRINPDVARQVMALGVPGISLQREYRRYYPAGEVTAQVLGFTGIDDAGQEGLELSYNEWLGGVPGSKRVLKDRLGRIVEDVESISPPRPGRDLRLSIDRRIQYLAHRELKAALTLQQAKAGSAVVLDVHSGEVLAMVNLPAYNPNRPNQTRSNGSRNRAVTDVFEPGSTIKPFTVAAALESGQYRADTLIETGPGFFKVGRKMIRDLHDYGLIDVSTVIQKSSNIGATKMALAIPPLRMWDVFSGSGFGVSTGSGFPGEASGLLTPYQRWRDLDRATLSFGYGLSVTPLQLAQAYTVLAGDGQLRPVSFLPVEYPPVGKPVMKAETAAQVRVMMERVINEGGTATLARVPGYRVAGKTGTVRKLGPGGYVQNRYLSLFAAMVPATRPRLVMVVMIDEPGNKDYYGGLVAAPVFSKVMTDALRLLDIAPDDLPTAPPHLLLTSNAPLAMPLVPTGLAVVSDEDVVSPIIPAASKTVKKEPAKPLAQVAVRTSDRPADLHREPSVTLPVKRPDSLAARATERRAPTPTPGPPNTSLAIDEILHIKNIIPSTSAATTGGKP
ncbi:MAG: penicillin-binding transpeptidase domain-containing protein [Gammaproteobacteria bacterium]